MPLKFCMRRVLAFLLFCYCGLIYAVTPGLDSRVVIVVSRFDTPITTPGDLKLVQTSPSDSAVGSAMAINNEMRVNRTGVSVS